MLVKVVARDVVPSYLGHRKARAAYVIDLLRERRIIQRAGDALVCPASGGYPCRSKTVIEVLLTSSIWALQDYQVASPLQNIVAGVSDSP